MECIFAMQNKNFMIASCNNITLGDLLNWTTNLFAPEIISNFRTSNSYKTTSNFNVLCLSYKKNHTKYIFAMQNKNYFV